MSPTMTQFLRHEKVLFKHCDPAGIVFFPRYFEMMNDLIEGFFADPLAYPFETLLKTHGIPTAQIETRFLRPSRHGDLLALRLGFERVGRSSASYRMTADCGGELRFETRATLVHVDGTGRPCPWPAAQREILKTYEAQDDP